MSLHCIVWCCMVLYCWLWRAGCISQDTYLLYLSNLQWTLYSGKYQQLQVYFNLNCPIKFLKLLLQCLEILTLPKITGDIKVKRWDIMRKPTWCKSQVQATGGTLVPADTRFTHFDLLKLLPHKNKGLCSCCLNWDIWVDSLHPS